MQTLHYICLRAPVAFAHPQPPGNRFIAFVQPLHYISLRALVAFVHRQPPGNRYIAFMHQILHYISLFTISLCATVTLAFVHNQPLRDQ